MRNTALIAGAVLALLLIAAVVVPPLIDWSRYKTEITSRVEAATGRTVTVDGLIALRLLPSPALSAEAITIGNPPGMAGELARVERLRLRLALLPLLTGRVQLTKVELERPVLTLARDTDGRANWDFGGTDTTAPEPAPSQEAPRRAARPEGEPATTAEVDESLPVQALTILDGTVRYGESLSVTELNADVALGGRSGPFVAKGTARLGGVEVALNASVDRLAPGRGSPANLSLRLPGDDAALEITGLISELSGGHTLRGRISLRAADPGRSMARLGVAPPPLPPGALSLSSDLVLSAAEANVTTLELSLGEARATGALMAGLGERPQIDLRLHAGALDLDKWTKAHEDIARTAPAVPPTTPSPGTAAPPAAQADAQAGGFTLPRDVFATVALEVDALSWRGQVVRQAKLEAVLDGGEVMLRQASAQLPGATDVSAEGALSAQNGQPAFDGTLRAKSDNAAALLDWLGANLGEDAPRRLEFTAPLALAWPEIKLNDVRLTADGVAARGNAALRLGDQPAVALAMVVGGMNVTAKGRVAEGHRVEDGAFSLNSPQGLRPLRAFGIRPPQALENLGALSAEGTVTGTLDALALDARAQSGGVTVATKGTLATLSTAPRGDLTVEARAASLSQVLRLFGDTQARGGGAFALDARINGDARALDITNLSLRAGTSSVSGGGRVELGGARPAITADLQADQLALDTLLGSERSGRLLPGGPLLPPSVAPQPQPVVPAAVGTNGSPFSREPLDLSVLSSFDAHLTMRAGSVTAKEWRLDNANLLANVQDGTATVERFTGKLLGGDFNATAKLTAGATPTLAGQLTLLGADLGAARLGGAGMTVTQGRTDAEARFTTSGRSSQDMAARLAGDGRLLVRNGVLDGFDLPAVNRQMGNLRNIGSLLGVVQAGLSGGRTPFSQLAGTFRAENGIVTSRDLTLEADGGGATAEASVNLPQWSTQTRIAIHLASAPQTPLGIRLEGPLDAPRKIIDANAIQQLLVSRGLGQALKGLGGEAPAQGQQGDQPREKNTGKNILKNLLKGLGGQ